MFIPTAVLVLLIVAAGQTLANIWDGRVSQQQHQQQNARPYAGESINPYHYDVYPQQDYPRLAKVQLMRSLENSSKTFNQVPKVSYYGVVGVGEPPKPMLLQFDTRTSEIWIPKYTWNPFASNLHYGKGYDKDDSSEYSSNESGPNQEYVIKHRGTSMTGRAFSDVLTLGYRGDTIDLPNNFPQLPIAPVGNQQYALVRFRQRFLGIQNAEDGQFKNAPFDGVIGLAPVAHSNTGNPNVLLSMQGPKRNETVINVDGLPQAIMLEPGVYNQLSQDFGIHEEKFSLWFNTLLDSKYGGELIFGGLDPSHYLGAVYYHPVESWYIWQLRAKYIMLDREVVSCPNGCLVTLDTGENDLIGPRADVENIYSLLGSERFAGTDIQVVNCDLVDRLPTMTVMIGSVPYALLPTNYIRMMKTLTSEYANTQVQVCYVTIRPHDDANEENWILGVNFLSAYYSVFDFKNRQIGFATKR